MLSYGADIDDEHSDMSAKPSTTILSLSAYIYNHKGSKRYILLSWFPVSYRQVWKAGVRK